MRAFKNEDETDWRKPAWGDTSDDNFCFRQSKSTATYSLWPIYSGWNDEKRKKKEKKKKKWYPSVYGP